MKVIASFNLNLKHKLNFVFKNCEFKLDFFYINTKITSILKYLLLTLCNDIVLSTVLVTAEVFSKTFPLAITS